MIQILNWVPECRDHPLVWVHEASCPLGSRKRLTKMFSCVSLFNFIYLPITLFNLILILHFFPYTLNCHNMFLHNHLFVLPFYLKKKKKKGCIHISLTSQTSFYLRIYKIPKYLTNTDTFISVYLCFVYKLQWRKWLISSARVLYSVILHLLQWNLLIKMLRAIWPLHRTFSYLRYCISRIYAIELWASSYILSSSFVWRSCFYCILHSTNTWTNPYSVTGTLPPKKL